MIILAVCHIVDFRDAAHRLGTQMVCATMAEAELLNIN